MPKVTEEYIQNKKNKIVEAALNVCMKKTISSVTMQDIINESGLSQGGIYRFYSDIDGILADMLSKIRNEINMEQEVDEVLNRNKPIKDLVEDIFTMLAEFMKRHLMTYHKIGFEFNLLITNYPVRAKKIFGQVKQDSIFDYLIKKTQKLLQNEIENGKLSPKLPFKDIISYISAAYDGIQMEAIVSNCYSERIKDNYACEYDIDQLFHALSISVCCLIGVM